MEETINKNDYCSYSSELRHRPELTSPNSPENEVLKSSTTSNQVITVD